MAESNLQINITGDSSKLSNALSSATSQLSSFGSKMQGIGKSLSTKLTLPLVAAGTAATKMAFDFNKSMTQIESLVGVASDEVTKMGEAAKKMAIDTGKSANEAAEALFFITSAGLRGSAATDTLNASLKAAAVGLGETKTIADLATSAMNGYANEGLTATQATDILVAAVREGKLEASQLAASMGGVIPIASNMGVGFNEVGAALAAMSRTGTNAAEGATQLNAILMSIKKPTDQSAEAMLSLGTSQQELTKSLAEKGLMPTLLDLSARLQATGMDASAIFPNIRALKGVMDLTGSGVADNVKIFDALNNTMGATDEAFKKTSKSASFQMTQGLNAMKSSLLAVGDVILKAVAPAVQKIGLFFTSLSEKFAALSPTTQKIIIAFGGIVAALGPVIAIIGTLITMAPTIGAAIALMTGPIGLVVAGLTAVSVVIYKNWAGIKNALIKIGNYFIELYNNSLPIRLAVDGIIMSFKNLVAVAKFVFSTLSTIVKLFGQNISTIFGSAADLIQGIFTFDIDKIKSGFSGLANGLKQNFTNAFESIKTEAVNLGSNVADNFNQALKSKKIDPITIPIITQGNGGTDEAVSTDEMIQSHIDANNQIVANDILTAQQRKEVKASNVMEMQGLDMAQKEQQITSDIEFNTLQADTETANYEEKKARFLGFMMEQQTAAQLMQKIGSQIDSSFGMIGNSITNMFGGAESATGAFIGTLAKDALKIIGHNLSISMTNGITGATESAKSFGPAAAFVLPALIAGATALIGSQFSKFADGGIVSGPTMGLVGEYPGARSNPEVIAPLNKLQGMIGGNGGTSNVNVTGSVRVDGQDLLIAFERANETAGRIY